MDSEERPLESTTRTFDTTEGVLTYAELSDLIAPKLLKLLDDITNGEFINRPYDESLITDFHYRIIGKVIPDIAGKWRSVPVGVGNWLPPEPFEIPIKMREYVNNMQVRINHADSLDLQIGTPLESIINRYKDPPRFSAEAGYFMFLRVIRVFRSGWQRQSRAEWQSAYWQPGSSRRCTGCGQPDHKMPCSQQAGACRRWP